MKGGFMGHAFYKVKGQRPIGDTPTLSKFTELVEKTVGVGINDNSPCNIVNVFGEALKLELEEVGWTDVSIHVLSASVGGNHTMTLSIDEINKKENIKATERRLKNIEDDIAYLFNNLL
jgi:hypothetical protein